jgi:DNA-binding HxlR family transcriptional regulator
VGVRIYRQGLCPAFPNVINRWFWERVREKVKRQNAHNIRYSYLVPSNTRASFKQKPISLKKAARKRVAQEARRFIKALRQIADPHALLIMRELSLGVRRFQNIQAQTRIGSHLLSSRLRRLERDGIIERRLYHDHPPRFEYFATAKGRDLDGLLFAALNWNIKWGGSLDEPSMAIFDKRTGERLGVAPPKTSKNRSRRATAG